MLSPGRSTRTSVSGAYLAVFQANECGGSVKKDILRQKGPMGDSVPQWIGMAMRGDSMATAQAASFGER